MLSGTAPPRFALAPPPARRLPARLLTFRRAWFAGCVLAAGGLAILLAPDRIERADILVTGAATPQAIAALETTLRATGADIGMAATAGDLALTLRHAASAIPFTDISPPALHALAAATVAAIAATQPQIAPIVQAAPDRSLLAAEREEAAAALARTETDLARLSAALTDLARDQAQLLQQDGAPTPDPDNAPTRKLLADLQARRIDLAARYTADFPGIAITDQEIAQLQALIAAPAKTGMSAAQAARSGALAVLRAEQGRVAGEYATAAARRDESLARIHAVEQSLAVAPPAVPSPLSMVVIDLPGQTLPDRRLLPLGAVATLALLCLLPLPRRRAVASPLGSQIAALEHAIGLPVITCLDAQGARLPLQDRLFLVPPPSSKSLFASFSSEKEESS